jgi:hypothetical protein
MNDGFAISRESRSHARCGRRRCRYGATRIRSSQEQVCGVLIAPPKNVTNRACGPIWLNSDAQGVANEGVSK